MEKTSIKAKIIFDYKKCIKCGLCSKVCGSSVIKISDGIPQFKFEELCCSCGHCAAICPNSAISSNNIENSRSFKTFEFEPTLDAVEKLLKSKRSVREFKNEVPDENTIKKIIEYAEKAPSSTNNRHRKYIVVTDKEQIAEIEKTVVMYFARLGKMINPLSIGVARAFSKSNGKNLTTTKADIRHMENTFRMGENPVLKNAPILILIAAPKKDIQAMDDCIIAQQYMMLYAESIGIGSCVNGYVQFAHKKVEKLLDISSGYSIYTAGIFGYSKYTYKKEIVYDKEIDITWR